MIFKLLFNFPLVGTHLSGEFGYPKSSIFVYLLFVLCYQFSFLLIILTMDNFIPSRGFRQEIITQVLDPKLFLYKHIMPNVNVPPFDTNDYTAVTYYTSCMICTNYILREQPANTIEAHARVVGEAWVPNLPNDMKYPTAEANKIFYEAWIFYVQHLSVSERLMASYKSTTMSDRFTVDFFDGELSKGTQAERIDCIHWLAPRVGREKWDLQGDLHQQTYSNMVLSLCSVIVAYVKQGNATTAFINKVSAAMVTERNANMTLTTDACNKIYSYYGRYVNATSARQFFRLAGQLIPLQMSLRLNLAIQQSAWSGLSSFVAIATAMKKYVDFPWAKARNIIPVEFVNFNEARKLIKNDAYYGYNQDLGAAKATNYPSLAWLGMNLHMQIGGINTWNNYAGINRNINNKPALSALINAYSQERAAMAGRDAHPTDKANMTAYIAQLETVGEMQMPDVFRPSEHFDSLVLPVLHSAMPEVQHEEEH
uniref:Putative nucleoprotein n=1 Tax=Atrato Chu-like virus 2 TaxID=2689323 RepID=A0A6B9KP08_9VIRU|nr:putative nucleoprotein [Atrato Chu-like virus 2]